MGDLVDEAKGMMDGNVGSGAARAKLANPEGVIGKVFTIRTRPLPSSTNNQESSRGQGQYKSGKGEERQVMTSEEASK